MPATSLTQSYNTFLTLTLHASRKKVADNVLKSTSLLWALLGGRALENGPPKADMRQGVRRENGGSKIRIPVMWRRNSTFGSIEGYEPVDVTPQDPITALFEDWKECAGSVAIDRKSSRLNAGPNGLLNITDELVNAATATMKEGVNQMLVQGTISSNVFVQGNGGKDMISLPMLAGHLGTVGGSNAAATPGTSLHSVNPEAETWWKNQYRAATVSSPTYQTFNQDLQIINDDCSKGSVGGMPTHVISDQLSYETWERSLMTQQRYGPYGADGEVSGGFRVLKFKQADWIWDEFIPDTYTPALTTATYGTAFFLNTNVMQLVIDSESEFVPTPFTRPYNQFALYSLMILMANLVVDNRRKIGVLNKIPRTIVA